MLGLYIRAYGHDYIVYFMVIKSVRAFGRFGLMRVRERPLRAFGRGNQSSSGVGLPEIITLVPHISAINRIWEILSRTCGVHTHVGERG